MTPYIKLLTLSIFISAGFNSAHAYQSHTADVRFAVDQKVNQVIASLNLVEGRKVNITAAAAYGVLTVILSTLNFDGNLTPAALISLSFCIYNIYRALQKTDAINDLEEIKKIVHNHVAHLQGYVQY